MGAGVALRVAPGTAADGLPPLDRQVLTLLLAGLTDRSIASQLGLSMRTVQRRVQAQMEEAGVQTRMQLGWRAARVGWT
jgi:DNA-binding NarL/FixJ family response regulator